MIKEYYGGFDTRRSIDGVLHPWRLLITDGRGEIHQRQIRLPHGQTWLSIPRDPIWGDLLNEGGGFEDQIESLAGDLPINIILHLHHRHNNLLTERVFRWNGITVKFHNIEIVNSDPLRIRGEAGCEIGSIMTNINLKKTLETA